MAARDPSASTVGSFQLRACLFGLLFLAAFGSFWFIRRDAAGYLTLNQEYYTSYYWSRRYALLLHVGGGLVALCVGLIQIYSGLTGRTSRPHRWLGRLYLFGVGSAAAAAFYLVTHIPVSIYSLGLAGLGIAWVVTTATGYNAVRRGEIARHRAWMIRSYVVTFGFVTLRVLQNVMMGLGVAGEDDSVSIAAWLCWVIPLVLVEPLLRSWHWESAASDRAASP